MRTPDVLRACEAGRAKALPKIPDPVAFEQSYPGTVDQVRHVRGDLAAAMPACPRADDLILLVSELTTNAVLHSKSGRVGGEFTVRVFLYTGDYAWVEVIDQGGPWTGRDGDDRPHGLDIVAAIAGDDDWGVEGGPACRVVWFRLNWADAS
jgi:serine/threonine-protein kinase RsbW